MIDCEFSTLDIACIVGILTVVLMLGLAVGYMVGFGKRGKRCKKAPDCVFHEEL